MNKKQRCGGHGVLPVYDGKDPGFADRSCPGCPDCQDRVWAECANEVFNETMNGPAKPEPPPDPPGIGEALEGLEAYFSYVEANDMGPVDAEKAHLQTLRVALESKPITGEIGEDLHGLKERLYWLRDAAKDYAATGKHRVEIEFETALGHYRAVREWVGRVKAAIPLDGKIIREQKVEIAQLRGEVEKHIVVRKSLSKNVAEFHDKCKQAEAKLDTMRRCRKEKNIEIIRLRGQLEVEEAHSAQMRLVVTNTDKSHRKIEAERDRLREVQSKTRKQQDAIINAQSESIREKKAEIARLTAKLEETQRMAVGMMGLLESALHPLGSKEDER